MKTIFTSESVTEGHPDKIADQISDSVLDAFLAADPDSRVACEVLVNTGLVVVSGEITSKADYIDIQKIARERIIEIGYDHGDMCFDGRSCAVLTALDEQSPDIAQGVDELPDHLQGAGDQGMMFGFACDETPELMPLPISLSHKLSRRLAAVRKDGTLAYLRPDGKVQVSVEYEDEKPKRVLAVVVSTQHAPEIAQTQIQEDIKREVIDPILGDLVDADTLYHINPTGKFVIGGPQGDCGLTGRKIIVDTYGGAAPHGGGAFSGKDPTKVDRSAAYASRYLAKNIVSAGVSKKCLIQLAYAIGVSKPLSIFVKLEDGDEEKVELVKKIIDKNFNLSPRGIREMLKLNNPIYEKTSAYGHFGRKPTNKGEFTWEKTDKADIFKL